VAVDSVAQVGYSTLLSLDGSYLNDRPPLVLQGRYVANGVPFPITVIGVHGRSLSGIDGAEANRVRQKRLEQSLELAAYIQGIQAAEPDRRIVVTGDFNAYQFSDGYVDVVGLVSGSLDPNGALQPGHADVVTPDLYNVVNALPEGERYSFVYGGSAQALDASQVGGGGGAIGRGGGGVVVSARRLGLRRVVAGSGAGALDLNHVVVALSLEGAQCILVALNVACQIGCAVLGLEAQQLRAGNGHVLPCGL